MISYISSRVSNVRHVQTFTECNAIPCYKTVPLLQLLYFFFYFKERCSSIDVSQHLYGPCSCSFWGTHLQSKLCDTHMHHARITPPLSNSPLSAFFLLCFLQSKQTSFRVIPHNPSLCLCSVLEHAFGVLVRRAPLIAQCRHVMFKAPLLLPAISPLHLSITGAWKNKAPMPLFQEVPDQ